MTAQVFHQTFISIFKTQSYYMKSTLIYNGKSFERLLEYVVVW